MKFTGGIWSSLRVFFGIFMVCVYLAMAYLMHINLFNWGPEMKWFRYLLAVVFALYGFYRAYRQIKGTDYYRLKSLQEEEKPEQNRIDKFIKEQRSRVDEKNIDNTKRVQNDEK